MSKKRASTVPGVYSAIEEAFFRAGAAAPEPESPEHFADLDEGYERVGFWRRLFGGIRR